MLPGAELRYRIVGDRKTVQAENFQPSNLRSGAKPFAVTWVSLKSAISAT